MSIGNALAYPELLHDEEICRFANGGIMKFIMIPSIQEKYPSLYGSWFTEYITTEIGTFYIF